MVTQIASRLGFGPRPQQTVYEYAGTLGDVLPDVRPELETVARAKVEVVVRAPGPRRRADRDPAGRPATAPGGAPAAGLPAQGAPPPPLAGRGRDALAAGARRRRAVRGRRRGRAPRAPRRLARSRASARWPVRLWARRTGRPARNSTTVIAHRSIDHIQNRSSGRSNRVSRVTLKTPSWPTTIVHGWSAAASP